MKLYDLSPTEENLKRTYREDSIGRNNSLFHFIRLLNTIESGFSIALDGHWGSGKTFFVKQAKMVLEANNEFTETMSLEAKQQIKEKQYSFFDEDETLIPQVCVYYDAWENDSDEDPILSLVYTIMQTVTSNFSFKDRKYFDAGIELLKGFVKRPFEQMSGVDLEKVIEDLKGDDSLETLRMSKKKDQRINEFLDSLLPERGDRLVIFVDELDRCSPEYAVKLLERIKHYFSNEKITFVFSINKIELQHTIKKHYGSSFDGYRYLDRFFDYSVELPPANIEKYYSQIGFESNEHIWEIVCKECGNTYNMQLRELSHYLYSCKITIGNYLNRRNNEGRHFLYDEYYYCLMCVVPIMLALKLVDGNRYKDFINGSDAEPLLRISDYLSPGFFQNLLNPGEQFSNDNFKSEENKVSVREKLNSVYEALFKTEYNYSKSSLRVGRAEFSKKTQDLIKQIISSLSDYAKLD